METEIFISIYLGLNLLFFFCRAVYSPFWLEYREACKAWKGLEESTEGVNCQPGKCDWIREGGSGGPPGAFQ